MQNRYQTEDFWYWPFAEVFNFFSLVTYNFNTVTVPEDEYKEANIGEIWFRLDTNIMDHTKKVFSFTQYLSSLAGMLGFLFTIAGNIFGSYICFQ